jgi:predicted transcriptional regulator
MLQTQDIFPLTAFLRDHKAHISRLQTSGRPEVLTVNGEASLVMMHAATFDKLMDLVNELEAAALREGIAAAERGEKRDAREVFSAIRKKYDLPA